MPNLIVLVPTRTRPYNVTRIVDAWWGTGAFEVAQLRFIIDEDDASYGAYRRLLDHLPEVTFHTAAEWQPLVPKLNGAALRVAEQGQFDNIAFMGDDHVPRTERWAHLLVERHKPDIWFQWGRDGIQDDKLSTWWSVKAEWVRTLGKMVPGDVEHLYCDNAVMALGNEAGLSRYNHDILIEHMHPLAGKAMKDAQYLRVNSEMQYHRDSSAFSAWRRSGLASDATLLRDAAEKLMWPPDQRLP